MKVISIRGSLLAVALVAAPAGAQHRHSTVSEAGRIVTQPGRDIGLVKTRIPAVLERAAANPYGTAGTATCHAIEASVSDLDDALGPDFGHATTRKGSRLGSLARMGGSAVIDGLIPFRGVVREVTGAAGADRRLAAAVNAGYARRGFLRGLSVQRHCRPSL